MAEVFLIDSDILAKFGRSDNLHLLEKVPGQVLITREVYSEVVDGANFAPGARAALDWINSNANNPKIAVSTVYLDRAERGVIFGNNGKDSGELSIDNVLNQAAALSDPDTFAVLSDNPQARVVAGFLANSGGVYYGHEYLGSMLAQGHISSTEYFEAVDRSNYTGATPFYGPPAIQPGLPYGIYAAEDRDVFGVPKEGSDPIGTVTYYPDGGALFQVDGEEAQYFAPGKQVGFQGSRETGQLVDMSSGSPVPVIDNDNCFGPAASISMWPLDPEFAPDPNNPYKQYDQDAVRPKIWKKPIELIRVGDYVVSHDKNGNMVPGYVPRTMSNGAKILLNFHDTPVTPGHVYYRPDSQKSYKYETLIDILRDDGMIEHSDAVKLRAATNVPVGTPRDGFVKAVTQTCKADGTVVQNDEGRIRLGTRFLVGEGKQRKSFAVADLIERGGGVVGDDELIRVNDGPAMPFLWDFGDTLPKPEDFVLACSGTTLEDIYNAAEWESQGPRLPAPMVLDRGPVQPLKGAALSAMPRNEPLDVVHSSMTSAKPQRTVNRKQRKAMEAKQRKSAKMRKRVVN